MTSIIGVMPYRALFLDSIVVTEFTSDNRQKCIIPEPALFLDMKACLNPLDEKMIGHRQLHLVHGKEIGCSYGHEETHCGDEGNDHEDCNSCQDLIGRVVSIHQPKDIQVKQNSQRLIDFVIEDCRESRLAVTLWDEHVDSVLPYFNGALTDPLIVIVQLCRARVTDSGISSSYSATRVLFNYECPEVFAFKDRFLTPVRTISSRSRNTGSGSLETMSNENITMTSLMDIYDDKKVGEFWVVGEIRDIQPDWYFIACASKGCGKKIQEINEQMYCKSCGVQSPDEIIKYKLVIDVLDDEQDGQLILWDNVCSPLLGFTASELKGKYSEEGCMPNEIGGLIGKTMKFMIVTREDQFKYKGNAAFTVLRVQSDEAKSNSFKKGEQGNVIRKLAEEK
nr:replication protein A 70 kDa DNA-binding subunit B-like [Ipomoea batatas]